MSNSTLSTVTMGDFGPDYFAGMLYTSPTTPSRIMINFKSGDDIALHVTPRYDEQALVLNTMANQQWQHEERPPGFPLDSGQSTQIVAVATDQSFDIFANKRQFFYSYNHRYDMTKINQIEFNGQKTPINPWVGRALPSFEIGKVIYIKGQAPTEGVFDVNLVPSLPHDYKREDMAMHLSFRFTENVVVRNHLANMEWAQEEREGGMPVSPGQPFSLTIVAQKEGFEVDVNGSHFCHFSYRVPLTEEMSVEITGVPSIEKIDYTVRLQHERAKHAAHRAFHNLCDCLCCKR